MSTPQDLPQEIHEILTKKKYNRGTPNLDRELLAIITTAVNANKAIPLVGLWGIGEKNFANWADEESCAYLCKLQQEVKEVYPPSLEFIFVFATQHALHNGYPAESIKSYTESIIKIFDTCNFKYMFLNTLWEKYGISFEKIDKELASKPSDWWDTISERTTIEKNASLRNNKYPPVVAAQKYFVMRDLEKEIFEKEFPTHIFHAFSDPDLKQVLPNMPTLYFWGIKKWRSDVPWFVYSDKDVN